MTSETCSLVGLATSIHSCTSNAHPSLPYSVPQCGGQQSRLSRDIGRVYILRTVLHPRVIYAWYTVQMLAAWCDPRLLVLLPPHRVSPSALRTINTSYLQYCQAAEPIGIEEAGNIDYWHDRGRNVQSTSQGQLLRKVGEVMRVVSAAENRTVASPMRA